MRVDEEKKRTKNFLLNQPKCLTIKMAVEKKYIERLYSYGMAKVSFFCVIEKLGEDC